MQIPVENNNQLGEDKEGDGGEEGDEESDGEVPGGPDQTTCHC